MSSLSLPKKAFFVGLVFVPFLGSVGAERLAPVVPAVAEVVLGAVEGTTFDVVVDEPLQAAVLPNMSPMKDPAAKGPAPTALALAL